MGSPHGPAAAGAQVGYARLGRTVGLLNGAGLVADGSAVRARARREPGYPAALEALADPPERVWLRGADVPAPGACVAIVGSRAASPYGRAVAHRLAADLAALGVAVVSGLARGIDAEAHRGALAAGGRTIAVVPSSLGRITPPEHAGLAEAIAGSGTLLSETGSGGPFGRGAFVKRNRLIAALAGATVVVEAAERSGALTTATAARALGRPVLAVPGDVDRPTARGGLDLLRSGARPCGDAGDVLAVLPAAPRAAALDPAARLAAALDGVPRTLDDLAGRAGLAPAEALATLLRLEWSGVAAPLPGQRWKARA